MRIGICSYWFNRGQATVGRHLRSALDQLGHHTAVLARPTPDTFVLRRHVAAGDVWDQRDVTVLSHHHAGPEEYLDWSRRNELDAVLFDQNYEFDAISALRADGVRTIGRFVWESFSAWHVDDARSAFEVVYSLTRAEQARYRQLGLESPYVPWGCHPELLGVRRPSRGDVVRFFYPAGFLSPRKPTGTVLEAFRRVERDDVRLVVKAQRPLRRSDVRRPTRLRDVDRRLTPMDRIALPTRWRRRLDPRVEVVIDDRPLDEYYALFASCDVCVGVSRWEGLGLHLYEATAFGMPIIGMGIPPIDEVAVDGLNAINVASHLLGHRAGSGLEAHEPDVDALERAFARMADEAERRRLEEGARQRRDELEWSITVDALDHLVRGTLT
jgi:1,2-diacylglycerol 3-alpha-glucosyltransferase